MAEPVELMVGFVYSVVYASISQRPMIIEGELLSFTDTQIEIKGAKGSLYIPMENVSKLTRK